MPFPRNWLSRQDSPAPVVSVALVVSVVALAVVVDSEPSVVFDAPLVLVSVLVSVFVSVSVFVFVLVSVLVLVAVLVLVLVAVSLLVVGPLSPAQAKRVTHAVASAAGMKGWRMGSAEQSTNASGRHFVARGEGGRAGLGVDAGENVRNRPARERACLAKIVPDRAPAGAGDGLR
jgi:hypothetical protein